jgi:hypothetical protein
VCWKALLLHQKRADRRIAPAEALRDGHEIGADPLLLAGMQRARAAHAAHHLIENKQDPMAAADVAYAPEITRHRRDRAHCGADNRLGDEGDDVLAAELLDFAVEFLRQAFAVGLRRLVGATFAIFVNGRHVVRLDQQRSELLALPFSAADRERPERDAVIALTARNDVSPPRLAAFDEILTRELECSLDRLRATAHEKDVTHSFRRVRDEIVGQFLRNLCCKEARMRVGEAVELIAHRRQDVRMRMTEA